MKSDKVFFLLLLLMSLCSCKDKATEEPFLTVEDTPLVFSAQPNVKTITCSSNAEIEVSSSQQLWCTATVAANGKFIVIKVTKNEPLAGERTATVTVTAGKAKAVTIEVKQLANDSYFEVLSENERHIGQEAAQFFIEVRTNVSIIAMSSQTSWCTVKITDSSSSDNKSVEINVTSNETFVERTAEITIVASAGFENVKIKVTQKGYAGTVESSRQHLLCTYCNFGDLHSKAYLMPFVVHIVNGQPDDMLFDSFYWLYSPPSDRLNTKIKWESWMDLLFTKNWNLDALNDAVGDAKVLLNRPNYRANVFITATVPLNEPNFGMVNGKNLDCTQFEDRKIALQWMVDEQISRFNAKNYRNLQLAGFSWHYEGMGDDGAMTIVQRFTDYVRSRGYVTYWGPYLRATGWDRWKEMGIDLATMQINYFYNTPLGIYNCGGPLNIKIMADLIHRSDQTGMGVGMETEIYLSDTPENLRKGVRHHKEYLKGGVEYDYMKDIHCWYWNGGIRGAYESSDPYIHSAYDEMYLYIKGILKLKDVNIGIDKTSFTIHSFSSQETYHQNSPAINIIDGKIDTPWHTQYYSNLPQWIIVDMKDTYNVSAIELVRFMYTKTVILEGSMDNSTWETLGTLVFPEPPDPKITKDQTYSKILDIPAGKRFRYLRLNFPDSYSSGDICLWEVYVFGEIVK